MDRIIETIPAAKGIMLDGKEDIPEHIQRGFAYFKGDVEVMYNGKMTEELKLLCEQYEKKFGSGYDPKGYMELHYGDDYKTFKRDVKRALKRGVELPDLYPIPDDAEC